MRRRGRLCSSANFSIGADVELVAGGHHDHVREQPHVRDVEDAVMRRAVRPGQAGAVEREDHRQVLQRDFLEDLVEDRCRNVE